MSDFFHRSISGFNQILCNLWHVQDGCKEINYSTFCIQRLLWIEMMLRTWVIFIYDTQYMVLHTYTTVPNLVKQRQLILLLIVAQNQFPFHIIKLIFSKKGYNCLIIIVCSIIGQCYFKPGWCNILLHTHLRRKKNKKMKLRSVLLSYSLRI